MIEILAVSDGHKHFSEAIEEYKKRLGKNIKIHLLRPDKSSSQEKIREKESQQILQYLQKKKSTYVIGLDEVGEHMDTKALVSLIEKKNIAGEHLTFVIGGAYGYDKDVLGGSIHAYICLGAFTLPHSLAFLILIEQLYRVQQIQKGSGYHHE